LLVVSWALLLDWSWALSLAFLTGLALDFSAGSLFPIGIQALLFCAVVLPVSLVSREYIQAGSLRSVPVGLAAALGYRVLLLLAGQLLGYNNLQLSNLTQVVIPVAIIDAALMVLVFILVRRLSNIGASRE
jgi:cell shape-determining protein MreD